MNFTAKNKKEQDNDLRVYGSYQKTIPELKGQKLIVVSGPQKGATGHLDSYLDPQGERVSLLINGGKIRVPVNTLMIYSDYIALCNKTVNQKINFAVPAPNQGGHPLPLEYSYIPA